MRAYLTQVNIGGSVITFMFFYLRKNYGRSGYSVVAAYPDKGKLYPTKIFPAAQSPAAAIIAWLNECEDFQTAALINSLEIKVRN